LIEGREYTFYFAWVAQGTPWDLSLARFDENIFDLTIEHDEGQIPTATIEIKNPRIGFISPGRLYWAWISFGYDACQPQPLFFGRLVGVPERIESNTVKMKLIARDTDYIYQKQQVAETLKKPPNYDPIFVEVLKRDDPDAILEGWSLLYHVDRVSGQVTASDILTGEDGILWFADSEVFYDSVQCKLLQSPLVAVNVKAEVNWNQQFKGALPPGGELGKWAFPTLGSDAFVGDWPKSGSSIGGGWYAGVSWAGERDPLIFPMKPAQPSYQFHWQNGEKQHITGDTMSIEISYTPPFGNSVVLKEFHQNGFIDEFAVDFHGDPAPVNIPAVSSVQYFCYEAFALDFAGKQSLAVISLVYNADRKRSERAEMTVQAEIQPILIDPLVTEDTETITLKSGDLSLPLIALENWDTVGMGRFVDVGTFIYPDNPLVPGQTSSQVCLTAGNTGMVEPVFSNIAGHTTTDGTVVWASLGDTPPTEQAQDQVRMANVGLGTIICPKPVSGIPNWEALLAPGSLSFPPSGVAVAKHSMYCMNWGGPGDTIKECIVAGMVGGLSEAPAAQFRTFQNPVGSYQYICIRAGQTGEFHPTFAEAKGAQTGDGSVIWQCIGLAKVPVGGWPGYTPHATYFPSDRGKQSIENMICRARAKLRKRARAVEVSFDTRFEVAAQLSCRMSGNVNDARLPGGTVQGKVIGYKLEVHGDTGEVKGNVTLGCSIGNERAGQPSPTPQPLPFRLVQGGAFLSGPVSVSSVHVTLQNPVSKESLICMAVGAQGADPTKETPTVTDNGGGHYNPADLVYDSAGSKYVLWTFYGTNIESGPLQFTLNFPHAHTNMVLIIEEFDASTGLALSGKDLNGWIAAHSLAQRSPGSANDAINSGSADVPADGALIWGVTVAVNESGGLSTLGGTTNGTNFKPGLINEGETGAWTTEWRQNPTAGGSGSTFTNAAHGGQSGKGWLTSFMAFNPCLGIVPSSGSRKVTRGVATDSGTPSYANEGYVQRGYQKYYSSVSGAPPDTLPVQGASFEVPPFDVPSVPPTLPPETCPALDSYWTPTIEDVAGNEIGYTPPFGHANDDGLGFPLGPSEVILANQWHGIPSTLNKNNLAIYNLQINEVVTEAVAQAQRTYAGNWTITNPPNPLIQLQTQIQTMIFKSIMQGEGLWYELTLKPVTNGPFANSYVVQTTKLQIPMTIDLSAASPAPEGLLRYARD
jgi:hypothetical protein